MFPQCVLSPNHEILAVIARVRVRPLIGSYVNSKRDDSRTCGNLTLWNGQEEFWSVDVVVVVWNKGSDFANLEQLHAVGINLKGGGDAVFEQGEAGLVR